MRLFNGVMFRVDIGPKGLSLCCTFLSLFAVSHGNLVHCARTIYKMMERRTKFQHNLRGWKVGLQNPHCRLCEFSTIRVELFPTNVVYWCLWASFSCHIQNALLYLILCFVERKGRIKYFGVKIKGFHSCFNRYNKLSREVRELARKIRDLDVKDSFRAKSTSQLLEKLWVFTS